MVLHQLHETTHSLYVLLKGDGSAHMVPRFMNRGVEVVSPEQVRGQTNTHFWKHAYVKFIIFA